MFNFLEETLTSDHITINAGQTANLRWSRPAAGVILFEPKNPTDTSIVISVGIHGNETAPIEIINQLVSKLLQDQYPLNVRLLVIMGNLEAMRQGKRYLTIDMNRLFSGHHQTHPLCYETQRADALEKLMKHFYDAAPEHHKQHFDLHTAIRASHHTRFGLLPYKQGADYPSKMQVYQVVDVLTKSSEHYKLHVDDQAKNFTPFETGFTFATDNGIGHPSQATTSYILFPNKQVKIGFRAGLVLKKITLSQLTSAS